METKETTQPPSKIEETRWTEMAEHMDVPSMKSFISNLVKDSSASEFIQKYLPKFGKSTETTKIGSKMRIETISTKQILPNEDIFSILDQYLPYVEEKDIVVINTKILSLCEGRYISKKDVSSKIDLINKEADYYLQEEAKGFHLTIKNNILVPSAGVKESNVQDGYVLYPKDPFLSASKIWEYLKKKHNLNQVGVLITDSHVTPMRRGVTGIAVAWCGFEALKNYVDKPDLFGKPLRVTYSNIVDGLASTAVLLMGQADEQTPLSLIKDFKTLTFQDRAPTKEEIGFLRMPLEEDLFKPLIKSVDWKSTKQTGGSTV